MKLLLKLIYVGAFVEAFVGTFVKAFVKSFVKTFVKSFVKAFGRAFVEPFVEAQLWQNVSFHQRGEPPMMIVIVKNPKIEEIKKIKSSLETTDHGQCTVQVRNHHRLG